MSGLEDFALKRLKWIRILALFLPRTWIFSQTSPYGKRRETRNSELVE
jgi:hypothetical protein